jgi:hypothetical protein
MRILALIAVIAAAALLFLLAAIPYAGGVCTAAGACRTADPAGLAELGLFGLACAGAGLLIRRRR